MSLAIYVRVSTQRQAQTQTIEQQLERLQAHIRNRGWELAVDPVFRDDGYSGASLNRPGLDRLRDAVRAAEVDRVPITDPDRLARNHVHQMVLLEELERRGCQVLFLDRPMSQDPHDHLLLQIRGAVAEYERNADRRADASGATDEAAGGEFAAVDPAAVRLSGGSGPSPRSGGRAGGTGGSGGDSRAVRPP